MIDPYRKIPHIKLAVTLHSYYFKHDSRRSCRCVTSIINGHGIVVFRLCFHIGT